MRLNKDEMNYVALTILVDYSAVHTAIWTQLTSTQIANLICISTRYRSAVNKCLRGRKWFEMIPKAGRKRCACPADLNRRITFSRTLVG